MTEITEYIVTPPALPLRRRERKGILPIDAVVGATIGCCATVLTWNQEPWIFMCAVAGSLALGLKWLTFRDAEFYGEQPTLLRILAWFLIWPGMNGRDFFNRAVIPARPEGAEILAALAKTAGGALLVWVIARQFVADAPLVAGWIAMAGLVLLFHFGMIHLVSILCRALGVAAAPIMKAPIFAHSPTDFWSRRWNTAFSIPARRLVLLPLARRIGTAGATVVVFFISGLLHEVVITLPAGGGYGGPTLYFLLQAGGILAQNSFPTLAGGWAGRIFTLLLVAGPVGWLFPPIFVRNVILPMLQAIGAT